MAIPYIDTNPKGNGYFTFKERRWEITIFLVGFLVLWCVLIVLGTFLRGPNWNFFGPYEFWDINKLVPAEQHQPLGDHLDQGLQAQPAQLLAVPRDLRPRARRVSTCACCRSCSRRRVLRRFFEKMDMPRYLIGVSLGAHDDVAADQDVPALDLQPEVHRVDPGVRVQHMRITVSHAPQAARRADRSSLQHPEAEPRLHVDGGDPHGRLHLDGHRRLPRDWKTIQRTFMRLDRSTRGNRRSRRGGRRSTRSTSSSSADLRASRAEIAAAGREPGRAQAKVKALDAAGLRRRPGLQVHEGGLRRGALQVRGRARQQAQGGAPSAKKDLDALRKELDERTVRLAQLRQQERRRQTEIDLINVRKEDIETTIEKRTADYRLARSKFASLKQDALFKLRNSPILDMVNPSLRIQQVQLPDHFINVNFMRIPRVDRCTTCHIAADRKGFEDPRIKDDIFRTHPRMHRMVGSESMHPAQSFGCTPCHGGRDRATSFWSAGHSPENDAAEGERGPRSTTGSSTASTRLRSCPSSTPRPAATAATRRRRTSREAPRLDAGMRIVESLGCWGCHRIDGLEKQHLPKVGPSLERVAAKVPRDWTTRWVMDPAAFRANTKMPTFFYLENFVDVSGPRKPDRRAAEDERAGEDRERHDGQRHRRVPLRTVPPRRRVSRLRPRRSRRAAQKLIAERGCFGCHEADPKAQRDLTGTYRQFGPNLSGVGSKASRDWIYHWIRDPKAWNPDTKMPNLRLTESDALDIAEYLSTLKAPASFDGGAAEDGREGPGFGSPSTSRCRRRRSSTRRPSSRRWTSTRRRSTRGGTSSRTTAATRATPSRASRTPSRSAPS